LPLVWQRDRDVPRSSAARELRFAEIATATLLRGAPQIVVSYAQGADDEEPPRPSELIASRKPASLAPRPTDVRDLTSARRIRASRPALETLPDLDAPPLAEAASVRGGAHAFEAQANCPFQAIGLHRLRAKPWPGVTVGLTPIERGTLVHAALASFWNDVRDHATLTTLDSAALDARIASATSAARAAIRTERWRWVPDVIAAGETARIHALLREWIARHERTRPPFVVEATEREVVLALAGIAFRLRIDRLDRIGDGVAIIDYKTGITPAPKLWFDERPRSPQIGLYTLARRQAEPESRTHAAVYAQLRSGELKVNGVADDVSLWPVLAPLDRTPAASWPALEAWWTAHLVALAEELRDGVATIAPREGEKTCRLCGLFALCRVRSAAIESRGIDDD
jgi:probable DNA repair protein